MHVVAVVPTEKFQKICEISGISTDIKMRRHWTVASETEQL